MCVREEPVQKEFRHLCPSANAMNDAYTQRHCFTPGQKRIASRHICWPDGAVRTKQPKIKNANKPEYEKVCLMYVSESVQNADSN